MDAEIIYILVGLVLFSIVAVFILRNDSGTKANTKEAKREEILNGYKKELYETLKELKDDKDAKIAKKSELLKRYNEELSLNIFFDKIEIREIIMELAENY